MRRRPLIFFPVTYMRYHNKVGRLVKFLHRFAAIRSCGLFEILNTRVVENTFDAVKAIMNFTRKTAFAVTTRTWLQPRIPRMLWTIRIADCFIVDFRTRTTRNNNTQQQSCLNSRFFFQLNSKILTLGLSESLTIRILSPDVSMPARPALPIICLY